MQRDRLFVQTNYRLFGIIRLFIGFDTLSILAMYSSLSSGTDHIFFPPRLEVVAEGSTRSFPATFGASLRFTASSAINPDGPPRPAFRRIAADHGNDPLALFGIQHTLRSRPLLVI